MKKVLIKMLIGLLTILAIWTILTFWAEAEGESKTWEAGNSLSHKKVLIVYDPDPFYNLDQQVCEAVGNVLAKNGWHVTYQTVKAAKKRSNTKFSLYVFCANTYNWSPDWSITSFIKKDIVIKGKNVAALTLGGGSTRRAQRLFENEIIERGGVLLGSRAYWLWRPNDDSRLKESNVKIAVEIAEKFGKEIVVSIKSDSDEIRK